MTAPDDRALTETGLAPAGAGRVLVIGCGALAHEILALKRANGWDHLDLACLPALWRNHPERIAPALRAAVHRARATRDRIPVASADRGTGGLARTCAELGVEMIARPLCHSLNDGLDAFAARSDDRGAAPAAPISSRQLDAFVWWLLGPERHPELAAHHFGKYDRLKPRPDRQPGARRPCAGCAARPGLADMRRVTGQGDLARFLAAPR